MRSIHPAILLFVCVLAGCGGGSKSQSTTSQTPPTTGGTPTTPAQPGAVTVAAGQVAGGVDIAVSAPASSPAANAIDLGVSDVGTGGSAFNTGATITRGVTKRVILFGDSLSGSMTVKLSGPNDVQIANVRSITSTGGKSGISFDLTTQANTAVGARTVFLTATNGDITTFTGGLEVLP